MKKPRPHISRKPVENLEDQEAYQRLLQMGYTKIGLAKIVGITKQAVTRWQSIPVKYVTRISEATGIRRRYLRPSDFK